MLYLTSYKKMEESETIFKSVDKLMEYHIGWYDLSYLVTIRDFLNGDYGGYDDEDEYDDDDDDDDDKIYSEFGCEMREFY